MQNNIQTIYFCIYNRLMKTQEDQLKKKALDLPVQLKNKRSCCL